MRTLLVGLMTVFLMLCLVNPCLAQTGTVTLTVDLGKGLGEVPFLFRAGVFNGNIIPTGHIFEKFITDLKPGAVELYLAHTTIRPSSNLQDLARRLSEWDHVARRVAEKGGEIVVEIAAMPWWLTANRSRKPVNPEVGDDTPIGNLSPPKDYNEWAKMVEVIVNHFNNQLKVKAKYTIWGEPDIVWWQGTEEEYFKLYRYAVLGAKRADRDAKVGGPAVSEWTGRRQGSQTPLIYNFIRYASQTELPELGLKRLPIDYINWHQFNANPLNPGSFGEPAQKIRGWLSEFGYDPNTEFLIGEWIIWQSFGKPHAFMNEEHDTEVTASYIISALLAMDAAGIGRHSFAYLVDSVPGKEFVGDFGLFTKGGITKASFNAFKALSLLEGNRVWVDNSDTTLRAIAAQKSGRIVIVISNFIPWGQMLQPQFAGMLRERGYTRESMAQHNINPEKLREALTGRIPIDSLNLPPKAKEDLKQIAAKARETQERRKNPVTVRLDLRNPGVGSYRVDQYVIDGTRSNAYALRDRIEAALRTTPTRTINDWPGVRFDRAQEARTADAGRPADIVIAPYGVVVLVLTPQ